MKPIQGQDRCGSCYQKYRHSPEYVPKGRGVKLLEEAAGVKNLPAVVSVKQKYTRKVEEPTHHHVTVPDDVYRELYMLKGQMLAVQDFIHGKLSGDALLSLLKGTVHA
jgi:hypothetical protein